MPGPGGRAAGGNRNRCTEDGRALSISAHRSLRTCGRLNFSPRHRARFLSVSARLPEGGGGFISHSGCNFDYSTLRTTWIQNVRTG